MILCLKTENSWRLELSGECGAGGVWEWCLGVGGVFPKSHIPLGIKDAIVEANAPVTGRLLCGGFVLSSLCGSLFLMCH